MRSKITTKILAALFAAIFLSGVLLIFIQNVFIFLISIIVIICIIIGMVIGLDYVRESELININEGHRNKKNKLEAIFAKDQELTDEKAKHKVKTLLCPLCGGKELYYEAGLITGYKYHCKDCDYIGAFVIEKDFKV